MLVIDVKKLSICTDLRGESGGHHQPTINVGGRCACIALRPQAITDDFLWDFSPRRATALRPFSALRDRFDTIVQRMRTPGPWPAATPALPAPFVLCDGRLRVGNTGKPAGLDALDVLCNALGLLNLGSDIGGGRLLG